MKTLCARLVILSGLVLLPASIASAVHVKTWHLDQPADLLSGTLDNLAITNRAELLLAPQVQRFALDPKETDTVNAMAIGPGGVPYVGTGPKGIIYRIKDNAVEKVADLPEGQVFSLLFLPDHTLLAGVGGTRGAIYRVEPSGKVTIFWQAADVRYVWSIVRDADGSIFAGTGSDGEIYRLSADGKQAAKLAQVTNTRNVLSLAIAGADRLVFGCDATGLIGAVNTKNGRLRILYDAGDRSITSLASRPDGTVYAAATKTGSEKTPIGAPPTRPQGKPDFGSESGSAAGTSGTRVQLAALAGTATNPSRDHQQGGQNTIYRIDAEGLTREIASLPGMLLAMAWQDGDLLVTTGNPGRVYRIEPTEERYTSLLREDASYFTAVAHDGESAWIGASRPATVTLMKPNCVAEGTFTSAPLDANLLSLWGQIKVNAAVPADAAVHVQTRSSNTHDVTGPGWSPWSEPAPAGDKDRPLVTSPPGRFLQVRLTLKASPDGRQSPLVRSIDVPYQAINLPPEISALSVATADVASKPPSSTSEWYTPDTKIEMEWQARDPNGDKLTYDLYVRKVGTDTWTRIARNLTKTSYTWDSQEMPDGLYEARVVASDALDNPPSLAQSRARISEPFTIDKTAPKIEDLEIHQTGDRTFHVTARLVDNLSNILAAQYTLDSSKTWINLLPVDGIFDSPQEALEFNVGPLSPGEHTLVIRVADEHGNVRSKRQTISVEE